MHGLARAVVVRGMTRRAVAEGPAEIAVVALIARERAMRAAQRERRPRPVIPRHRRPGCRAVAVLAFIAETRAIDIVLLANPVAVVAARGRAFEHALEMTIAARNREVTPFETLLSSSGFSLLAR